MSVVTGPFDVAYPVNFYSGGDTTKDAFGKHIQEIKRIYGIINAINADAISADEFQTKLNQHINDSNPHPYLMLSKLLGTLDFSKITGNVPASRITGTLSSSVIPTLGTNKISGLEDYVKTITQKAIGNEKDNNSYLYVGGILLQWGLFQIKEKVYNQNHDISILLPRSYKIFDFRHWNNGVLESTTQHALYTTEVFKVANGVNNTMLIDVHDDYTVSDGKTDTSFIVTVKLDTNNSGAWEEGAYLLWNAWGIKGPEVTVNA